MTLRSDKEAQDFLSRAIASIPLSWWEDYRGKDIFRVLSILERNARRGCAEKRRAYGNIMNPILRGTHTPTVPEFMALMLQRAYPRRKRRSLRGPSRSWWLSIRDRGYENIVGWNPQTTKPPLYNDPEKDWEQWFRDEYKTMHPVRPRSRLAPGPRSFFDTVVHRLKVDGVDKDKIRWRIAGCDLLQPAETLRALFENGAGHPNTDPPAVADASHLHSPESPIAQVSGIAVDGGASPSPKSSDNGTPSINQAADRPRTPSEGHGNQCNTAESTAANTTNPSPAQSTITRSMPESTSRHTQTTPTISFQTQNPPVTPDPRPGFSRDLRETAEKLLNLHHEANLAYRQIACWRRNLHAE